VRGPKGTVVNSRASLGNVLGISGSAYVVKKQSGGIVLQRNVRAVDEDLVLQLFSSAAWRSRATRLRTLLCRLMRLRPCRAAGPRSHRLRRLRCGPPSTRSALLAVALRCCGRATRATSSATSLPTTSRPGASSSITSSMTIQARYRRPRTWTSGTASTRAAATPPLSGASPMTSARPLPTRVPRCPGARCAALPARHRRARTPTRLTQSPRSR